jgi:hypothetical protein
LFGPETQPDKPNKPDQPDEPERRESRLFPLQVMQLVDEALELGHGVAALVGGDLLIDGEGHGFDGGAHLVNGVLIGWGACLVGIHDQQGAQFTGDDFGRARLAEERQ